MSLDLREVTVKNILTRTSGYLGVVATHSLQPYRGCTFGRSLCGVGCYVQHNRFVTRGRAWGSFLEVRVNAAASYLASARREGEWARRSGRAFSIFMSSSTDPFLPQERRYGITSSLLDAMLIEPPDQLIVQTHSAAVASYLRQLCALSAKCAVRVHLSIESDRERLPGLPPPASSVEARLQAAGQLKSAGIFTVITAAPLLPLEDPARFFARCGSVSNALVLDHYVGGDGSPLGARTLRTALPAAMDEADPGSSDPAYQEQALRWAGEFYPGPIGFGPEGFGGRYTYVPSVLPSTPEAG